MRLFPAMLLVLGLVTVGCGESPSGNAGGSAAGDDTIPLNFGDAAFGGGGKDADGQGSGGGVADGSADLDGTGVDPGGDGVADAPKPAGCPGAAGCACVAAEDCDTTLCLETPDGKRCAKTCSDACPGGTVCAALPLGSDFVQACVSAWARLCSPCASHSDCNPPGLTGARCLDGGDGPDTCGSPCQQDVDCPAGSLCKASLDINGASSTQCVPVGPDGGKGQCLCSDNAVNLGFSTACTAKLTQDGQELACAGIATCTSAGSPLTCSAGAPTKEICDGVDNDCDGTVDEGSCDDGNNCTADNCGTDGTCSNPPLQTGTPCDADGSVCTVDDACDAGTCVPGPLLACDDGNPCTKDSCDLAAGCTQVAFNGVPCSDDNPCTLGDVCQQGNCAPGKPKVCTAPGPCYGVACDPNSGNCTFPPLQAGLPCDDNSACTEADSCDAGTCAGKLVSCDDGNPCTNDSCDSAKGCASTANTAACDDGDVCTVQDVCASGVCAGQPKVCDDNNACTSDSCAKGIGCQAAAVADQSPCGVDASTWCVQGVCAKKKASGLACSDAAECASGFCVEGVCCGNACAGGCESCIALWTGSIDGQCQPIKAGIDPDNECQAMDPTTCGFTGMCNGNGACAKYAIGTPCSDAKCTADGSLQAGGSCGVNGCNPGKIQACDDGDACTVGDGCSNGGCTSGVAKNCDDGNACTNDSCASASGCKHVNNSASCDDGSACTLNDSCTGGVCKPGTPKVCDDGNPCTTDSCAALSGCKAIANTAPCDDGNACTVNDTCSGSQCKAGSAKNCDDGIACTVDSCSGGTCNHDGASCCNPVPFLDTFTGGNKGWTFSNSAGVTQGWQIVQNAPKFKSASAALYYGSTATNSFNFGSSSGVATSPLMPVPAGKASKLWFSLYMDTESGTTYDLLTVNLIKSNGTKSTILDKATPGVTTLSWGDFYLDVTQYGGQSIRLEFIFNTVDSIANSGLGVLVDDVSIETACQ